MCHWNSMIVKRTHKKNGIVVLEEEYEISETDIKKTLPPDHLPKVITEEFANSGFTKR